MRRPFLIAVLLAWSVSTPLAAQATPPSQPTAAVTRDADPALWIVQDEDTRIYLFGTVHFLKPGLGWFDEAIRDAFDDSDQLVLELVPPDPQEMQQTVMAMAISSSGPTLSEKLPADRRASFGDALTGLGVPANGLDRFEPWFAATTISVLAITKSGFEPNSGTETLLVTAAREQQKPIIGLETAEQQLGYLDTMPDPLQLRFLLQAVDDLPRAETMLDGIITAWAQGEPETLARLMNEGMRQNSEIGEILLTQRNRNWADWIEERLEAPGTIFVAVGAGHLAGDGSVQAQLAGKGIDAARIEY